MNLLKKSIEKAFILRDNGNFKSINPFALSFFMQDIKNQKTIKGRQ